MIEQTKQILIEKLMSQSGLGRISAPIENVSGGFLHRMYKVTTEQGCFAVKHLNSEIMSRADAKDNYARAEQLELIMEEHDIPMVPSIVISGKKMQKVEDDYFYIFKWQQGNSTDWGNISEEQCRLAGNILGKIHAISPQTVSHTEPGRCEYNWNQYVAMSKALNCEITDDLIQARELLYYAQEEVNKARKILPDIQCISDEDMDPKNVMWYEGIPKVIDLECLDYGNPVSHVLQLALQWSGVTTCAIDTKKVRAFFDGYFKAYDNGFRDYSDVFGLAYTWIEWLAYNIDRALGNCMDEDERQMGICQVKETIKRIRYLKDNEKYIKDTLVSYMSGIEISLNLMK